MKKPKNMARRSLDGNRQSVQPLRMPRSLRGHELSATGTMAAGRMVPIGYAGLLREDAVRRGMVRYSFEMQETAEILMNAVHCTVQAYLVPYLAFERFDGMDQLNRSYMGVPEREGEQPIPFFATEVRGAIGSNPVLENLGLHGAETDTINLCYNEAYNLIWNFRAANRSPGLTPRAMTDKTLAPAFWKHDRYKHIVPDFDQARIDGEVALNVVDARMPVDGIRLLGAGASASVTGTNSKGESVTEAGWRVSSQTENLYAGDAWLNVKEGAAGVPDVWAELQSDGITVSLSNIELAKKTAAFAKLREQYEGHSDEYLIDMMMQGISVPEQALKQPILLASQSTIFGMSKRYASDGANLTESVVNGATFVDLNIRVPRLNTGGIIMVVAECVPDQLFERQQDPLLFTTSPDQLPDALRDELDPEKVDVVYNRYVDTAHTTPDGVFGYEPLNAKWDIKARRVGGEMYRPAVDGSFDEKRQRIWSVEQANPTLSEDFYLSTNIHTKPFADQTIAPFEFAAQGGLVIEGNTVFGPALQESSDAYAEVLAEAPTQTIEK